MTKRRKSSRKRTPETEVQAQPGAPLVMRRTFPPGTIPRPPVPAPPVVRPVATCDCGSTDVEVSSSKGPLVYYRCRRCVDPATLDYTIFKRSRVETA